MTINDATTEDAPILNGGRYSLAEVLVLLAKMHHAKDVFYALAQRSGWHQFLEFAGLMSKYIELVERAYEKTGEFVVLPMEGHDAEYLLDKLDCIFGPSAAITITPWAEVERVRTRQEP
jgi:hypothetical protein